jgi:hypothetical protein
MAKGEVELIRTRYVWWVFAVFYGFVILLTAGTALNPSAPAPGRVVCGLIAIAIAGFMMRARRAGVETDSDYVLVRQYSGRASRVSWPEVDSFTLTGTSPFNSGVFIAVRLKNGRILKTQGLVAPSRRSKSAAALVAHLESRRPR